MIIMVEEKTEKKIVKKKETKPKEKEEKKIEPKKEKKAEAFKSNFKFSAEKDPWKIIQYPLLTEKNIRSVETENKLAFIVRREATKPQIKWALESALEVRIDRINTLIDREGRKKAIVKLAPGFKAIDIATRFGML